MNNIAAGFIEFWEILTGVLSDHKSTVIRLSCFALLLFGAMYAVLGYFQARRISDVDEPVNDAQFSEITIPQNDTSLNRIAELARTVNAMRQGSETLAGSLDGMNRNLFTIDSYNELGFEDLSGTGVNAPIQAQNEIPNVEVKAVIISQTSRVAVINAGGITGLIVRRGSDLPGGAGKVKDIRANKIIVCVNEQDIEYPLINSN